MKKRIYYLIGFLTILVINYLVKEYLIQDSTKDINYINFYEILLETLSPIAFFLLISFFSPRKPKAVSVAGLLVFVMIIEIIMRYYGDKELINYNELIGLVIGSTLLFAFEWFENKQTNKNEKQIAD